MGTIFINYRRHADRNWFAEELRDALTGRFTDERVFLDVSSIDIGLRYPDALRVHLDRADVVLVVVHHGWVRDLKNGHDWVRQEIQESLKQGKTIVPVLLDGADMPTAGELPKEIRELANRQAHRVLLRSKEQDVERLVETLASILLPLWERPNSANVSPTPERRWVGPVAIGVAAVALAVPVFVVPGDTQELATEIFVLSAACMLAPMLALIAVCWSRKPINAAEQQAQRLDPTRYYLWIGFPAGLFGVGVIVALVFSSPVAPAVRPWLIFIAAVSFVYLVTIVLKQYEKERRRDRNWPEKLPEPVKAAPVRRELERLEGKLATETNDPEQQYNRAAWHITHLRNAAEVLSVDAKRGRWAWLTADQTTALIGYAVWAPATVGVMAAVTLPHLGATAVTAAVVGAIVAVTAEFPYRRQRWLRQQVAAEVHRKVLGLADRLNS
jgi:hypothetical protein